MELVVGVKDNLSIGCVSCGNLGPPRLETSRVGNDLSGEPSAQANTLSQSMKVSYVSIIAAEVVRVKYSVSAPDHMSAGGRVVSAVFTYLPVT